LGKKWLEFHRDRPYPGPAIQICPELGGSAAGRRRASALAAMTWAAHAGF